MADRTRPRAVTVNVRIGRTQRAPAAKTCMNCRNSFALLDTKTGRPKYQRCRKSGADEKADKSLCGVMRRGACGPDAVLWEAK